MAAARMKLLRNRREAQVRKMRGDIAALLRDGREDTARIRVRPHAFRPPFPFPPSSVLDMARFASVRVSVHRLLAAVYFRRCFGALIESAFLLLLRLRRCESRESRRRWRGYGRKLLVDLDKIGQQILGMDNFDVEGDYSCLKFGVSTFTYFLFYCIL
jgi:hypothetical protein